MELEYPTISSLNIENSFGERMIATIPTNAPDGVEFGTKLCLQEMNITSL